MHKLILFSLLVSATACSTLKYGDPRAQETVSIDFGSTDLQELAGGMVDSLLRAPQLSYVAGAEREDPRIVVYVGDLRNRTSEHIDTAGITDSIKVSLLKSGRFRFVASDAGQDEIGDRVRFEQESGRVDPADAVAFGRQIGADVVIHGTLRSIEKERGRSLGNLGTKTEDVYYQMVLECVDLSTGELVWAEEQDIRKTEKRRIFG